ncbi:MAG: hypothetical protein OXG85_03180 [Chloroflexi bacterium]|nr:hypothetical protein [Chloroflexota bacterium]
MAWTTPKTDWKTGELVAASDMNAIGENLAVLRNLGSASYITTERISKLGHTYTDVDSENLNLSITTSGGDVLVGFSGSLTRNNDNSCHLDIDVDGVSQGGVISQGVPGHSVYSVSFTRMIQGLSAGSHSFKLRWRGSHRDRGFSLLTGAQFWVREI